MRTVLAFVVGLMVVASPLVASRASACDGKKCHTKKCKLKKKDGDKAAPAPAEKPADKT